MRLLRLTPWRRGPALLAGRPGIALALGAAALVACLPAAAAAMFLSSAQHATLHRQLAETCQWRVGAQVTSPISPPHNQTFFGPTLGPGAVVGTERFRAREAVVADLAPVGLAAPLSTLHGLVNAELVDRPLPLPDLRGLTLLGRDGFASHMSVLAGPSGPGLWLPHEYAAQQGISVGDELRLTARTATIGTWHWPPPAAEPADRSIVMPVSAIYRDLRVAPDTPYWCGVADLYRGPPDPQVDPRPPVALVDSQQFLEIGEATRLFASHRIELALANPVLPAPQAATLAADLEALLLELSAEHQPLFPSQLHGGVDNTEYGSLLPRYQRRAALVRDGLLPPVLPITAAGTAVGLAVAAAAAVFWVERRRRELAVLAAHGVGAGPLGIKAVVEALPAVVAGAAAGWAAAWGLVAGVGPSPVLSPGVLPLAALFVAGIAVVALALIGTVAAAGARGLTDARPPSLGGRWWRHIPWELALLAGAALAWMVLTADRVTDTGAGGVGAVAHVPSRLLVTPILAITGLAILAGRLAAGWLRGRGSARAAAGPARLLAWRRAARAAVATSILAVATAVPVAMATFGAAATDSIRSTADAQLRFGLGSDTVITYPRPIDRAAASRDTPAPAMPAPPEPVAAQATEVLRLTQQRIDGLYVDLIGVDPATFPTAAFWDDRIPGPSLRESVDLLTVDGTPIVLASRRIQPGPAVLTVRGQDILVQVAATRPIPGEQSAYPLVVVDRRLLERTLSDRDLATFHPQWWIAGEPGETLAAIAEAELPVARVATVDEHRAGAVYEPVTYSFQYLIALSIFTGLIGAVGLLLYLESRIASHRRAYVMLRRLGLRPSAHRRALLLEIGGPVLAGLAAGTAAAIGTAYAVRPGFDVNPGRFPGALLALPLTMTAAVCLCALGFGLAAGLLAHRRVARANPAEVLRDT